MRSWNFYSKRRKVSLERFVSGLATLDEVLERFTQKEIIPPDSEAIILALKNNGISVQETAFAEDLAAASKKPKRRAKNSHKRRKPRPSKASNEEQEFDEIVIIDTEETSSD